MESTMDMDIKDEFDVEDDWQEEMEAAEEACANVLPEISKQRYLKVYNSFCEWRKDKKVQGINENVMLRYFNEKIKYLKASSLWSTYSMLKATIQINENVGISEYKNLLAVLKGQNDKYEPKKSKVLTMENVRKFINDAPDDTFLLTKVVLIFGLNGACRRGELYSLKVDDIEDTGKRLIISLRDIRTKKKRAFTVGSECNGYELYHKYFRLRPKNVQTNRFFIFYANGKCTVQHVGLNSFAKMPKKIAEFLKLPNASSYTGHCLRRTSANLLANDGADIQTPKRHGGGGWQSTSVTEGYIEESIGNKGKSSKKVFVQISQVSQERQESGCQELQTSNIEISNVNNCVFNFYSNKN